jgi:hypothetical protein
MNAPTQRAVSPTTNNSLGAALGIAIIGTVCERAPSTMSALPGGALATAGGLLIAGFTALSPITRQRGPEGSAREDRSQTVDGSSMGRMHDEVRPRPAVGLQHRESGLG